MLTLPIHDLPTRSASGFIIRYILPRSIPPQLVGPLARKISFSALTIGDAIIGVGHGSPSEFCGHNNQVILDTKSIPDVKGKVVILISCETAQRLGPSLLDAGAISYIGFKDDLVWVMDSDLASTPWADGEFAGKCLMPVVDGLNALLDGKSAREALDIELEGYTRNAEVEEDELVKCCLEFNRDNAVLLGDESAKIRPRLGLFLPFRLIPPPPIFLPIS